MTTETMPEVRPAEPTTPIKPSEAIRLGRLIRPVPCSGYAIGGANEACALGAMALGWGGQEDDDAAWDLAWDRLHDLGVDPRDIWQPFDAAVWAKDPDPDAAAVALLESRGL